MPCFCPCPCHTSHSILLHTSHSKGTEAACAVKEGRWPALPWEALVTWHTLSPITKEMRWERDSLPRYRALLAWPHGTGTQGHTHHVVPLLVHQQVRLRQVGGVRGSAVSVCCQSWAATPRNTLTHAYLDFLTPLEDEQVHHLCQGPTR